MKKHHIMLVTLVAVILVAVFLLPPKKIDEKAAPTPAEQTAPAETVAPAAVTSSAENTGEAAIGGPFSLVNQDNQPVTEQAYQGKLMLVYFGFTYCPEICPTDLMLMTNVMKSLTPEEASQVVPVFITVDPERDTVEKMKQYLSSFDPSIQGLTGSREQVDGAIKAYRVYAKKVQEEGMTDYTMDHSAYLYLMSRDGKYIMHFQHNEKPDVVAEGIRAHLKD
jgi:cytochrome oxidase Cu insertion factor (SCO1/SenC/PrrC family)